MLDRDKVRTILSEEDPGKEPIYDAMTDDALMQEFDHYIIQPLMSWLKAGWVGIKFKKVNGDIRNLVCTLHSEYLPDRDAEQEIAKNKRARNDDVIAVWDRENEGWRSFRKDTIVEVWCLTPQFGAK